LFATGINNTSETGGKFAAGISFTPVANFPPVSTTPAKLVAKFAAGVVDTGGKFAINDTGEYLREFSIKFETVYWVTGAGG
jgi:hypothetical protein